MANGCRDRQKTGKPFPNDHLDAFFNAAVDCAIVLATFIRVRHDGRTWVLSHQRDPGPPGRGKWAVDLPNRAVPVAGLCVGCPVQPGSITPRLSLKTTVHRDRYGDRDVPPRLTTTTAAAR